MDLAERIAAEERIGFPSLVEKQPPAQLARNVIAVLFGLLKRPQILEQIRTVFGHRLPVEGVVVAHDERGFVISIAGVTAYCPPSEIDLEPFVGDPEEYVGRTLEFRILTMTPDAEAIVVSRAVLQREAADPWDTVADRYPPGAEFSGTIVRVQERAFIIEVEPGVEGIAHSSQLPLGAGLTVGTAVTGWVRAVDPDERRLFLSLRSIDDRWAQMAKRYPAGTVVDAVVQSITQDGAIVELEPGLRASLALSQVLRPNFGRYARGESVRVRVIRVDVETRQITVAEEPEEHYLA